MSDLSRLMRIAAETIYGEARGEPYVGKVAVGWVIRNRAARPAWWGRDVIGVCLSPGQFSCHNPGDPNFALLTRVSDNDPSMSECYRAVVDGVMGFAVDPTHGAMHYKVRGTVAEWDAAVAGCVPVSIGRHDFYRLNSLGKVE